MNRHARILNTIKLYVIVTFYIPTVSVSKNERDGQKIVEFLVGSSPRDRANLS